MRSTIWSLAQGKPQRQATASSSETSMSDVSARGQLSCQRSTQLGNWPEASAQASKAVASVKRSTPASRNSNRRCPWRVRSGHWTCWSGSCRPAK